MHSDSTVENKLINLKGSRYIFLLNLGTNFMQWRIQGGGLRGACMGPPRNA